MRENVGCRVGWGVDRRFVLSMNGKNFVVPNPPLTLHAYMDQGNIPIF